MVDAAVGGVTTVLVGATDVGAGDVGDVGGTVGGVVGAVVAVTVVVVAGAPVVVGRGGRVLVERGAVVVERGGRVVVGSGTSRGAALEPSEPIDRTTTPAGVATTAVTARVSWAAGAHTSNPASAAHPTRRCPLFMVATGTPRPITDR